MIFEWPIYDCSGIVDKLNILKSQSLVFRTRTMFALFFLVTPVLNVHFLYPGPLNEQEADYDCVRQTPVTLALQNLPVVL